SLLGKRRRARVANATAAATVEPVEARRLLSGNGLTATYFDNDDLTGKSISRVDPTVNFDWGAGSPNGAIAADTFSARWTGQIQSTDRRVHFNWGTAAPMSGIGADTYSVRWTGQVMAQKTEEYTFYTQSDDGVRVWVNGQKLIDNWSVHAPAENSGKIKLEA